jgi:hypothetical protein
MQKSPIFKQATRSAAGRLITILNEVRGDADPYRPFPVHLSLDLRSGELIYCPLGC